MKLLYLALALVSVVCTKAETHRIHIRVTHNKANATVSSVHRIPTKHQYHKDLGAGPRRKIYVLNSCPYNVLYQVGPIDGAPQPGTNGNWLGINEENVITVAHNWRGLFTACQGDSCEVENGPQTRVEISFDPSGVDYYYVSVVNGVNVPMSVEPLGVEYDQNDPYNCGAPGKATGLPSGMECSWFISLFQKNMIYNAVYGGSGDDCDSPDDCQDNEKCGYKYKADGGLGFYCGYRYGYYTGSQICLSDPTNEYFQCAESAGDDTGLTMADLYTCADPYISGYQRNAKGQEGSVCGCANWEELGINVFETEKCQATNPVWAKKVAPTLEFLKKGCATALTYQYDEASSLFSCGGQKEFLVTFCPNGDGIRTHPPEH